MHKAFENEVKEQLELVRKKALTDENIFSQLMEATKVCTIGQITQSLFGVGGQYRRNM